MMGTRGAGLALASLALVSSGANASRGESASRAPARVVLANRTIVTGGDSVAATVTLPRDVKLDALLRFRGAEGPTPQVSIAGEGRVAGVALVEQGTRTPAFFIAGRFRGCSARGCGSSWRPYNFLYTHRGGSRRVTLPKGVYTLHLIADGSRVRTTLTLPGLSGSVALNPGRASGASVVSPSVEVEGPGTFASWRDRLAIPRNSFVLTSIRGIADAYAGFRAYECGYEKGLPAPEPVAFAPGFCEAYLLQLEELNVTPGIAALASGCAATPGYTEVGRKGVLGCSEIYWMRREMTLAYGGHFVSPTPVDHMNVTLLILPLH